MERGAIQGVDNILEQAYREGRTTLYEFEVYQILDKIGVEVPRHLFVKTPEEADAELLQSFGKQLVLKIVSPQIIHKQKLGGVKILRNWEAAQIPELLREMEREVLAHFPQDPPEIAGFLLVEFVHYSPALGYETMIGCREDSEFGPVMLLSKGGDDAEFFAANYDAANLILAPISLEEARRFVGSLKIARKYRERGMEQCLEPLADALAKVSSLAAHYTSAAENPKYILEALDLNPLVLTEGGKWVAVDGFAQFLPAEKVQIHRPEARVENLDAFFHPQSVAIVGVSSDPARPSVAREIAKLMHSAGQRQLFLVNPRGGSLEINGEVYPLYKSIKDLPEPVDLVVYAAPLASTAQFMENLGEKAKAVIVISGLPADLEYSRFVEEMDKVKPPALRILGPNCMGIYSAPHQGRGVNTLFIEEKRLFLKHSERSSTVLLTQSGALALTAVDELANSRVFKTIVSFGNKYDVQITDLLAYFASQQDLDLIALYLEGLAPGEGRLFFELAKASPVPLVVYKSGKTEAGAKAAASHTAALSGDYAVFRAACQQAGVVLAAKLEDYYDYIKIFSLLAKKKPQGRRLAAVVNAGFESTLVGDELGSLQLAELGEATRAKLREIDRHSLVDLSTSLLDVTPMADDELFTAYVETVLQDPNVDLVVVGIVPHANALKSTSETCGDPRSMANLLVELGKKYEKPLVVSVNGGRQFQDFTAVMEKGGLPVFANVRAAVHALETFIRYHLG